MAQNPNSILEPGVPLGMQSNAPAKLTTKRLTQVLLGGAGLVLLGGGGILMGLNSNLTALQTTAQQKDAEVASNEQIAHRYQTTLDNYTQTQARIQYLEASVSDKAYVPTLLAQLEGLAAQTHLTVSAVRPAAPPPPAPPAAPASADSGSGTASAKKAAPPPYDTLNVSVDISGSYADTSMFLYSLTRFPKIISVASVQMHPGPPLVPGAPAQVVTNLKLTAFIFHDPNAPATPLSALTPVSAGAAVPMPSASAVPMPSAGAVPAPADGTVGGAVGRAGMGAVSVTRDANTRSAAQMKTL